MIAIIDYGMGNLHSVYKAVQRLGYEVEVTDDAKRILAADGAILPGVGAFGDAMFNLQQSGLDHVTKEFVKLGKPLLGICLGMQLLFTDSEEYGHHEGLQLLMGRVIKFQGSYKIPHMGWNRLEYKQPSPLTANLEEGHVYFVHSFHVEAEHSSDVLATADYNQEVTAIVGRGHVYGMQFHPEKSGTVGMHLLHNFLKLCNQKATVQL